MPSWPLPELLKLPPEVRKAAREAELALSSEQQTELERRWTEHLHDPSSAVPWEEVRRKFQR